MTFSSSDMPAAATTLFTAYASFAASMMLVRSMANDLLPSPVRSYLQSALHYLFAPLLSTQLTVKVDEHCGISRNEVYDAADLYLRTKINPNTTKRFKVGKTCKQKSLNISIEKGEEIIDSFRNFHLKWRSDSTEPQNGYSGGEKRFFELSFNKKFKDTVLNEYLPFVLAKSKEIKDGDKVVKLYTRDCRPFHYEEEGRGGGVWRSTNLDHPATFDTLAMDPELKRAVIDDLDRFVRRKEFYKKVGKAWKRGYLLYGPPGTGKSSLIAAMANYLKFDIYDLELTSLKSNSELRTILVSTTNRSIIVIEDIDCSVEMQDRQMGVLQGGPSNTKFTLSGLLNFIDGLWSSCGDERIIIFTTNHRDRLDPALLRPGRMDMHIHMSYCTSEGFKLLASNYLGIHDHHMLSAEIEGLIGNVEVTPAEVAEELMKSDDANAALAGVVNFLKRKKMEANEIKTVETNGLEVLQEANELEVQETKRLKIDNITRKSVRNIGRKVVRGGKSRRR